MSLSHCAKNEVAVDWKWGDEVTASFNGWDSTPDASPSMRIWGHWAANDDITSYAGSAGGNNTYTDGSGWNEVSHTWTVPDPQDDEFALVIEARLYSYPSTSDPQRYDLLDR